LGSTIALTGPSGNTLAQYKYDPYGDVTMTGTSSNPYQFTGRESDGTGLYYFRARYYYPDAGRFLSEDPAGFEGGVNLYGYAANDPVLFEDPFGLYCWCAFSISTGEFRCQGFGNYRYIDTPGYSGLGYNQNNLAGTDVPGVESTGGVLIAGGPIPMGTWTISGAHYGRFGNPYFKLTATPNVLIPRGRSGRKGSFMIHSDSSRHPHQSSIGCIVIDQTSRVKLAQCDGGTLSVTP